MKGLSNKYIIQKADGTPVDANADYFVLRIDEDKQARMALKTYIKAIKNINPQLAYDLEKKLAQYET